MVTNVKPYAVFYWHTTAKRRDLALGVLVMEDPHFLAESYNKFKELADESHPGAAFYPIGMLPLEEVPSRWKFKK